MLSISMKFHFKNRDRAFALIRHGVVEVPRTAARVVRPYVEKLVTAARNVTVDFAYYRKVLPKLGNNLALAKQLRRIGESHQDRKGGYVRLAKIDRRTVDARPLVRMSFMDFKNKKNEK